MTTLRQIEANRRNATLSSGPRTDAGKTAARTNAFKHGLSGAGAVRTEEETALVAKRLEDWRDSFCPADAYDEWLLEQAVLLSIRIDRGFTHDLALRMLAVERAETSWEEARRQAAEELGARLTRQPSMITSQLRGTRQGCEWLIERWQGLAGLLRVGRDWDEAQRDLALDLLGTPAELRDVSCLDPFGVAGADLRAARLAVAELEVAELELLREESLAGLDEMERTSARMGCSPEFDRETLLQMRYESANSRRMRQALSQLRQQKRPEGVAPTKPRPSPTLDPAPSPVIPPTLLLDDAAPEVDNVTPLQAPPTPRPEAADVPEPSPSRPASEVVTLPLIAAPSQPAPSPVSTVPPPPMGRGGLAGRFATSASASAGNRRARRAQQSRDRRA
jgi:hypothetical protein